MTCEMCALSPGDLVTFTNIKGTCSRCQFPYLINFVSGAYIGLRGDMHAFKLDHEVICFNCNGDGDELAVPCPDFIPLKLKSAIGFEEVLNVKHK